MTAPTTPLSSRMAGVLLGLLGTGVALLTVAYLGIRYVVWPRIDAFRPEIVSLLGHQLGRPVSIDALHPEWQGLHPALRIDGLRIDGADGAPRLEVTSAYARVSWRSVARGEPRFAALSLDAPHVVVERLAPGRFAVAGIEIAATGAPDGHGADWLLTQGAIDVRGASVEVIDRTGAIEPLRVGGVAAAMRSTGRRHQASVSIAEPGEAAAALALVAEIYRPPFSRPSDWRRWDGAGHLSGQRVDVARIAALLQAFGVALPEPAATAEGRLDVLAWLKIDDATVVESTVKARADRAATRLEDGRLAFDAIEGELRVERQRDGGHVLKVSRLSAIDAEGFALAADGDAEIGLDAARGLRSAWLRLKAFDAGGALSAVRRLPLPAAARERIAGLGLSGDVRDLTVRWLSPDAPSSELRPADRSDDTARARPTLARFELSASFDRLGVQLGETASGHRLPGAGNLSGSIRASDREGSLVLASARAVIALPGVLVEPSIAFDRLDADIAWTRDPSDETAPLRVALQRLAVSSPDLRGSAQGTWRGGAAGLGVIDVGARFDRVDLRSVSRYLPARADPHSREWVEHALVGGTVDEVRIDARGDLNDFPFHAPSEGRFRVTAAVRDLTLAYAPQWPRIEQLRGEVRFDADGMEARASQGVAGVTRLSDVVARIADWYENVLTVDGRAAGPAQDMLRFVNASPIAPLVSAFTRDLVVAGDARLGAKLLLPLHDVNAARVNGTVELAGNDVQIDTTVPTFGSVSGRVEFSERGVALPDLRGTFLGGPIRVDGRPAGEGRMRVDASGSVDAAGLRQLDDNALLRRLEGRTDWRATVDVDRRASTLRIESDLVGLSSALPPPFAKAAAESWPLRIVSRPLSPPDAAARPPGDRIDVRLRGDLGVSLERDRDPATERLFVRRAGIGLGVEPVVRDNGLAVLVRTRALDVDAWRAVIGDGELERLQRDARTGAPGGLSWVPDLVSVVADDLVVAGRDLHEVVVGASRADGRWRATVASREVEGHFEWRDAKPGERIGTLVARFARLVLPRSRESEVESALSASPASLPALDVVADELVLGTLPMGRLELAARNGGTAEQPVWTLDRLVLAQPSARLEARGAWSFAGVPRDPRAAPAPAPADRDARTTSLDFELDVRDAGRLLETMGLKDTVHGGSGSLAGSVRWHGSPIGLDYGSLDGRMNLSIGRGEFLKVDPGAAKLIGVLNMQSLPKRLSGDFRDLFAEGFAFDSIAGSVRVDDGVARTTDLTIRGLQAHVGIRGEADLHNETQRLAVEVVPQLNAGLASLAVGAMINPLVGLGSFAAQYVLQKPLQQVLAYEVDVTGSWTDPTVSERSRRPLQVQPPPRP